MADAARIARPWLLPMLRQQVKTHTIARPCIGLAYSSSTGKSGSNRAERAKRDRFKNLKEQERAARQRMNSTGQVDAMAAFLLPQTIVAPPIWRFPRSPIAFAKMVWLLARNRVATTGALLGVMFTSMRTKGFGWPLFRANKRAAVPAAKALHVQMSEAVAARDKETLRRVCTGEMFQTLAGAIDSRPRHVRAEWQLLRYEDRLRYPRLADFRVAYLPIPGSKSMRLIKQAVVTISSVQRLAKYDMDNGGQLIPGSLREKHMTEHIVLQANVHDKTYESEPWRVWGHLQESSYETIRDDLALYEATMTASRGSR
ncbi:hypothetical protein GGR51DRAFT_498452 [Nemania sp. FL0031]|nr:hypothetical protein GGR51DRAFT_498452 [Nemania sp. FL0031]